jgi:hypothetical protein
MSPTLRRGGGGGGCQPMPGSKRHRDEAVESKDGDVIPDLLLKHSDAIFTTYV